MTTNAPSTQTSTATLPSTLTLGPVHLNVTDLDRSVGFYQDAIGLQQHRREGSEAALGAGAGDLVVLHEEPNARPPGRHAGLYHFALLYPSREQLARALHRLAVTRTQIDGASDHGVSEAIYLPDPDGNGIELYADRPRDHWPAAGEGERVLMFTQPLDIYALLDTVAGDDPQRHAEPGLVMGHMHLHVGDIQRALDFYRDIIGFELMTMFPPSAAFLATGGYHHHLGVNTWRGQGAPPAPADAVGLRRWTVNFDDADQVTEARERIEAAGIETGDAEAGFLLRDPWNNALEIAPR